jgi:dipeptidyl aminopeptidase/acylaminoacyl peptidase
MTKRFDDEGRDIMALSLDTRATRVLVTGVLQARFLPPRHLLYARGGLLLAVAFDPVRLEAQGPAVPVLQDVTMFPRSSGSALFATSSHGSVAYIPGYSRALDRSLVFVDRKGHMTPATPARRPYLNPALSPDGRQVAVTIEGPTSDDIWVGDLARDVWNRLTVQGDNNMAAWAPDGRSLVFATNREDFFGIATTPVSGGSAPVALTRQNAPWGWDQIAIAPVGKTLAFGAHVRATSMDVWTMERGDADSARPFLSTPADENSPSFSPDGRYLAYASDESRRSEVYVRSFPDGMESLRVSETGGRDPVWARGGGEIFYRSGNQMMRVAVTTGHGLRLGTPEALFEIPATIRDAVLGRNFDVRADGQRFLMVQSSSSPQLHQIVLVPALRDEIRE